MSKSKAKSNKQNKSVLKSTMPKGKSPKPQEMEELVRLFNCGRYVEAIPIAISMTERYPQHELGWKALAVMFMHIGRSADALMPMQKAASLLPYDAELHFNLGNILWDLGRLDEAASSYQRALQRNPNYAEALSNLSNVLHGMGRLGEAEASCRRTIQFMPRNAGVHYNLGRILHDMDRFEEAITSYQQALGIKPDYVEAHNNLGYTLKVLGRLDEAAACCQQVLRIRPDYAEAHNKLGHTLYDMGRLDEAVASFRRTLEIRPDCFAYAADTHLMLPIIPESVEDIASWRERYQSGVSVLETDNFVDTPDDLYLHSFYLAYHNRNDRPLIWQAPAISNRRIRVGFLSEYLVEHTIGKLYQGLIRYLDRNRFEVVVIHTTKAKQDNFRQSLNALADKSITLPVSLWMQQQAIAAENLDVLFYPDIGMASSTYSLAYARLAPVQAVSWGHLDTTGLDTVDYFVSATSIEPEDAEDHYTERLIRLNRLPCFYQPLIVPTQKSDRAAMGLPETGTLYGCPQSLFKFHLDFDAVLTTIAEGGPTGRIVVLEGRNPTIGGLLKARWAKNFPILLERVLFLPRMPQDRFMTLMAHVDVLLDPIREYALRGHGLWQPSGDVAGTVSARPDCGGGISANGRRRCTHCPECGRIRALGSGSGKRSGTPPDFALSVTGCGRPRAVLDMQAVREFEAFLEAAVAAAGKGEKLPKGWQPDIQVSKIQPGVIV